MLRAQEREQPRIGTGRIIDWSSIKPSGSKPWGTSAQDRHDCLTCRNTPNRLEGLLRFPEKEAKMKRSILLLALAVTGFMAASPDRARAVVYCQYIEYPAGCIVRPGVVLRPRPVARAVVTPGVGAVGTPMNRGGPVNRVGRR